MSRRRAMRAREAAHHRRQAASSAGRCPVCGRGLRGRDKRRGKHEHCADPGLYDDGGKR